MASIARSPEPRRSSPTAGLLIVRELLDGVHHFDELDRSLPGVSRALLVERLRRLEQTGVIVRRTHPTRHVEYHLTNAGRKLQRISIRGSRSTCACAHSHAGSRGARC